MTTPPFKIDDGNDENKKIRSHELTRIF